MAKKNYEKLAKEIVRYIGGPENVNALVHCATRLRFKVKNTQNVDKKKLEQLEGVITVLDSGGQIQVVIGQHVADVYDTIFEVTDLKKENPSDAEESGEKKNLLNTFMDTISGIFAPVLGVMSGAGMLKALLILCTTFGWLKADMGTFLSPKGQSHTIQITVTNHQTQTFCICFRDRYFKTKTVSLKGICCNTVSHVSFHPK